MEDLKCDSYICLGILNRFNKDNNRSISYGLGLRLKFHSFEQTKSEKFLNFSTCMCDCHTPHSIYSTNNLVVSLFQLDLVQCLNIGTFIGNSLA